MRGIAAFPMRLFDLLSGIDHVLLLYADTEEAPDGAGRSAGETGGGAVERLVACAQQAQEETRGLLRS